MEPEENGPPPRPVKKMSSEADSKDGTVIPPPRPTKGGIAKKLTHKAAEDAERVNKEEELAPPVPAHRQIPTTVSGGNKTGEGNKDTPVASENKTQLPKPSKRPIEVKENKEPVGKQAPAATKVKDGEKQSPLAKPISRSSAGKENEKKPATQEKSKEKTETVAEEKSEPATAASKNQPKVTTKRLIANTPLKTLAEAPEILQSDKRRSSGQSEHSTKAPSSDKLKSPSSGKLKSPSSDKLKAPSSDKLESASATPSSPSTAGGDLDSPSTSNTSEKSDAGKASTASVGKDKDKSKKKGGLFKFLKKKEDKDFKTSERASVTEQGGPPRDLTPQQAQEDAMQAMYNKMRSKQVGPGGVMASPSFTKLAPETSPPQARGTSQNWTPITLGGEEGPPKNLGNNTLFTNLKGGTPGQNQEGSNPPSDNEGEDAEEKAPHQVAATDVDLEEAVNKRLLSKAKKGVTGSVPVPASYDENEEELEVQFNQCLQLAGVKKKKRADYEKYTRAQKWEYVVNVTAKYGMQQRQASTYIDNINATLGMDSSQLDIDGVVLNLKALRVAFKNEPASFLLDFNRNHGLEAIRDLITRMYHLQNNNPDLNLKEVQTECVRCIYMFMQVPESFYQTAENTTLLKVLAKLISTDSSVNEMCGEIMEIFGCVALIGPLGNQSALEALQALKVLDKEKYRFQHLVSLLDTQDQTLQITCMQLINALTNAHHLPVDLRIHIRNDFALAGLNEKLEELKKADNERLKNHIALWEQNAVWDNQTIARRIKKVQEEFTDLDEVFRWVKDLTAGTPAAMEFKRLLQSVVLVPRNQMVKVNGQDNQVPISCYLKLIQRLCERVVVSTTGYDPDFNHFTVDQDSLLESPIETGELAALEHNNNQLQKLFQDSTHLSVPEHIKMCSHIYHLSKTKTELQKQLEDMKKLGLKPSLDEDSSVRENERMIKLLIDCEEALKKRIEALEDVQGKADIYKKMFPDGKIKLGASNMTEPQTREVMEDILKSLGNGPGTGGTGNGGGNGKGGSGGPGGPPGGKPGAGPPGPAAAAPPAPAVAKPKAAPKEDSSLAAQLAAKKEAKAGGPPPPPAPGGGPPPPPPPPGASASSKKAYSIVPEVQLRRLNWNKVMDRNVKGTIWENSKEEKYIDILDWKALENAFCVKRVAQDLDDMPLPVRKKLDVYIMDSKKTHNLAILLNRLMSTHSLDWFRDRLLRCDEDDHPDITQQILMMLERYQPSAEERQMLVDFKGDRSALCVADRFVLHMVLEVPRFEQRLKFMILRRSFDSSVALVMEWISNINLASQEVMSSMNLKDVLSMLLMIGNYMNCSIASVGSVGGFKLDFLPSLGNTKTADNKQTLNNYLADVMRTKAPHLLEFGKDLQHCESAAKVQMQVLQSDMKDIGTNLAQLKNELDNHALYAEGDFFKSKYEHFHDKAIVQFQEVQAEFEKMMTNLKSAMKFYAYDTLTTTVDEFFSIFSTFCRQIQAADEENLAREKQIERLKRREEATAARRAAEAKRIQQRGRAKPTKQPEVGDILAALRTGNAFT
eukprot:Ihof_evm3s234 gene=Ihof_evmTU3s234